MNIILETCFIASAAICLSFNSNDHVSSVSKTAHQEMSDFLDQRMVEYTSGNNIPNAVIALVTADSIHFLKGYGFADLDNQLAVDPAYHLFRTGSVSKIFTWTAIMQLYERGLVDLDTDISAYSKPNIAHRLPDSFFNPNPLMDGLIQVGTWIVGIMGIILLASGLRLWLRGSGTVAVKVYQSIYALWAMGVTWVFYFYNYFGV